MPTQIDSLEIAITATATKAVNALDNLMTKLTGLDDALSRINGASLTNLSKGIDSLTSAMRSFNDENVKTQDFTRLKKNIDNLASVNSAGLNRASDGIIALSDAFKNLSGVSAYTAQVTDMLKALSKFGYTSMDKAVKNIPVLATNLRTLIETLATAPKVSQNIIDMTNALANLASQGTQIRTASSAMSQGIGGVTRTARAARSSLFSLSSAIGKFYATYFLVIRSIKGIWTSIESSMDYVETFNYLNVSIGKMGESVAKNMGEVGVEAATKYSDEFRATLNKLNEKLTGFTTGKSGELINAQMTNIGLNPEQLMNYQARIGAMTQSVGLLGNVSLDAQKALSMLASDMSSLTNVDLETVMNNFVSGISGQSKVLYKYGIDITQAALAEKALELGVTKSVSAMTQSEKMQLRLIKILEDSKVAWGDVANTVGSVANQYRIFKQNVSNLGRVIGNLFIPIVQKALPVINGFMVALRGLFSAIGFQTYGGTWLTDIMDGISGGSIGVDDVTDSIDDLDDSLDGASSSAKKLKQQLQGFDELNVLTTKDSSGKDLLGSSFDLSKELDAALADYESVWNKAFEGMQNTVQAYANKFEKAFDPIKGFWALLNTGNFFAAGSYVSTMSKKIFDGLSTAIENVDWREIGNDIGDFLSGINWITVLSSAGNFFEKIVNAAADLWKGSMDNSPLETAIITALLTAKWTGLDKLFDGLISKAIPGSVSVSKTITLVGLTFTLGFEFGKWLGEKIFTDTPDTYRTFRWFGEGGFFKIISDTDADIALKALRDMLSDESIWKILDNFNLSFVNIKKKALDLNDSFIKVFGISIPDLLKSDKFKSSVKTWLDNMNPMSKFVDGFTSSWELLKKGIDDVKSAIDKIKDALKDNSFIEKLNNIFSVGTSSSKWSFKSIFGYASGGFVKSADLFMANENGIPELVGTVGGKTAVASGTEITGISDAVYATGETQASLLQTAVGLLQVIANNGGGRMTDEEIFTSFRRSATNYTNRTGNPAIPI